MPIIGITASSNQTIKLTNYISIATTTVGAGGTSSVVFSNIPSTYTHLQVRMIYRVSSAGEGNITMRLNSDSANNYSLHYMFADTSQIAGGALANTNLNISGRTPGAAQLANSFGVSTVDILDYKNTNKFKLIKSLTGWNANGTGAIYMASSGYRSTNAISTITITDQNGGNLVQFSSFALYGVL